MGVGALEGTQDGRDVAVGKVEGNVDVVGALELVGAVLGRLEVDGAEEEVGAMLGGLDAVGANETVGRQIGLLDPVGEADVLGAVVGTGVCAMVGGAVGPPNQAGGKVNEGVG